MSTTTQRPTPETDQAWAKWPYAGPGVHANFARKLERERDEARVQLEAMREAMRISFDILHDLVEHIDACDEERLLACDNDPHPPSVFSVYGKHAEAALAKLQPFLKP